MGVGLLWTVVDNVDNGNGHQQRLQLQTQHGTALRSQSANHSATTQTNCCDKTRKRHAKQILDTTILAANKYTFVATTFVFSAFKVG